VKLLGEPPEERKVKPKEISQIEQGDFKQGRLVLNVTAPRIDWTYTVKIQEKEPPDFSHGVPSMGPFDECLSDFLVVMNTWLMEMSPTIGRLAFGAVLSQAVQSHVAGYKLLQSYLPAVKVDPDNSFDFNYQINRPRNSQLGINDLRVNRLCKWNVITAQAHLFTSGKSVVKDIDIYSARLELDINTHQSYSDELPHEALVRLLSELVDLGKEIAEKGDVP